MKIGTPPDGSLVKDEQKGLQELPKSEDNPALVIHKIESHLINKRICRRRSDVDRGHSCVGRRPDLESSVA